MGLEYALLSIGIFVACIVADSILKTNVFRRWKALLMAYGMGLIIAIPWDIFAIARGHWWLGESYLIGINLVNVPIEELLVMANLLFIPIIAWEYFKRENGKKR